MKPTDKKRKDRLDYNMRNYERFFGEEAGKSGTIPSFLSIDEEALKQKKRRKRRVLVVVILLLVVSVASVFMLRKTLWGRDKHTGSEGVTYSEDMRGRTEAHINSDVSYAKDEASKSTCEGDPDSIPDYFGEDYVIINDGQPNFTQWDYDNMSGQKFTDLDKLGRCGCAYAKLDHSMMPTEERGEIGKVKPTGWVQNKYPGIVESSPPYLYNRCHLIAYALTGENANELNLITGTRYFNKNIMLPWEEKVMRYLDKSENHVMYRVTPYFEGKELLARGVEMEAYSIEDEGEGVCFHIFAYNIQPGIELDYATGENKAAE